MRWTAVFILAASLHVSASGFSQNVTIKAHDAPLERIFQEIQAQTGFSFLWNQETFDKTRRIDLDVADAPLERVLDICLQGLPLTYRIKDKFVFIEPRKIPSVAPEAPHGAVSGRVADAKGHSLEGASVVVRGDGFNGRFTTTGKDGTFLFDDMPDGAYTVIISFVGYEPQTLRTTVTGKMVALKVVLRENLNPLEEVTVMGYTTKREAEITGSVQKLSGDAIRAGVTSPDAVDMLQGRTPGLYITNQGEGDPTNSGGSMLVHGVGSISNIGGSTSDFVQPSAILTPLIVVDGEIMPSQLNLKDVVNPQDIESITVLKDASSTAIYGSRAAAGVIVVTTKRGKGIGTHVNFSLKYGVNTPNRGNIHLLSGPQLYNYQKTYFTEDYAQNGSLYALIYGATTVDQYLALMLPSLSQVQDSSFDYQKYGFNNAHTQEANVSVSGGAENMKYYVDIGYYNEQGTGIDNGLSRKTFRLNLDGRISRRFSFNASLNGIFDDGTQDNSGFSNGLYPVFELLPWVYPYNANGTPKQSLTYNIFGFTNTIGNFLYDKQYNFIDFRKQQMYGSLKINYRITDWLSASSTNSFNLGYGASKNYIDSRTYLGSAFGANGALSESNTYYNAILTSNVLTVHHLWRSHSVQALVGQEYGTNYNSDMYLSTNGLPAGYSSLSLAQSLGNAYNYGTGSYAVNAGGTEANGLVFSVFGELNYNYKEKYFLTSSFRTDGSSSFGADKRYGTFYSFGGGWLLSRENFLKGSRWVDLLKLRANYGTSGTQNGNNFLTQTLYNSGLTYSSRAAAVVESLGNPALQWETARNMGAGVDYGLFGNRIGGSVDYYDRRSVNLIQRVILPSVAGFPSQYKNTGEVQNKGVELALTTVNVRTRDFTWTTSFNVSFNTNRLVRATGDSLQTGGFFTYYLHPGDDVSTLKAVKNVGVDAATGQPLYQELVFGGDGKLTGTRTVRTLDSVLALNDPRQMQKIGTMQPRYFGGITNTFRYKRFTLSTLLYYQVGNVLLNLVKYQYQMASVAYANEVAYVKGQVLWTTPGQANATEPSLYQQANSDWISQYNSHFYDNGSYLRLRNIRVSYDFSPGSLSRLKIGQAQLYASADNLFTLTHRGFIGSDPAGSPASYGYESGGSGVGFGTGAPRRYLLGLNVTF